MKPLTKKVIGEISDLMKATIKKLKTVMINPPSLYPSSSGNVMKSISDRLMNISNSLSDITRATDPDKTNQAQDEFLSMFLKNLKRRLKSLQVHLTEKRPPPDVYMVNFTFMLEEIREMFSEGKLITSYQISKPEPRKWWQDNFGDEVVISWNCFGTCFIREFDIEKGNFDRLHECFSFTSTEYVSIFAFDLFTRLYTPWKQMKDVWTTLAVKSSAYMGFISFSSMRQCLKLMKPGCFGYRVSCSNVGYWSVGYVTAAGTPSQTICWCRPLADHLKLGNLQSLYLSTTSDEPFPNLDNILNLIVNVELPPDYMPDYTFSDNIEKCIICFEEPLDLRIEPCGHFCGQKCIRNCMSKCKMMKCPVCRREIKSISIVKRQQSLLQLPSVPSAVSSPVSFSIALHFFSCYPRSQSMIQGWFLLCI
ncbi:hypothetical protein Ciccas_002926 [Cichlidogyrus casuarinus]|uniref:E3 ubiquitin-protein ligase CBL n=1 Tax=Cichlidogyrus casuarinus TaxID=1844966 RepID=A0ABD2QG88_9PLAT